MNKTRTNVKGQIRAWLIDQFFNVTPSQLNLGRDFKTTATVLDNGVHIVVEGPGVKEAYEVIIRSKE
jgi:hypothetical protein